MSCLSAKFCVAVGSRASSGGKSVSALTESWDGTSWSLMPNTSSATSDTELTGVSCVSVKFCVAVGLAVPLSGGSTTGEHIVAEAWRGTKWSVMPMASSTGMTMIVDRVSCFAINFCVAVGETGTSSSGTSSSGTTATSNSLIESWNGKSWSLTTSPSTGEKFSDLVGVSCPAVDFCAAVGEDGKVSAKKITLKALTESWDGQHWSVVANPADSMLLSALSGVSCTSKAFCVAVGEGIGGLFEAWHGSTWTTLTSPGKATYSDVSCVPIGSTAPSCSAVGATGGAVAIGVGGSAGSGSGGAIGSSTCMIVQSACPLSAVPPLPVIKTAIAQSRNGTTWSTVSSPTVAGSDSLLQGVSCTTGALCAAVGVTLSKNLKEATSLIEMNG